MKYPSLPEPGMPEYKLQRWLAMVPGVLTWSTLIGAFVFSFWQPVWVAVFVIIYDLYWLFKALVIGGHSILAYRRMRRIVKINWLRKCQNIKNSHGLDLKEIVHLIVIPYCQEGLEILEPTIKAIADSNFLLDQVVVVMSGEKKAGPGVGERGLILKEKYGRFFRTFLTTVHPVSSGKMSNKSANANWAAEKGIAYLKKENIDSDRVIVSNFDCDTCIHKQYLANVTYRFLASKNRYRESYQPLPMYNNNIWDTIAIVRVVSLGCSFWHMIESTRPERLITFSSHSMSLKALLDVGLWQRDVISDDSAIFWQCYIFYDGDYRSVPLYIPVSMDATLSTSVKKTIINEYKQKRRWAYGIEHFPRVTRAFLRNKKIPFGERLRHLGIILGGHYSWATSSLLIMILGWLPLFIGGSKFNETVLAHYLPLLTRNILIIAMLGLLVSTFLSFFLLPPKPKRYGKAKYIPMVFQWALVPVIASLMGSIPAIDSQTRLMLGKYVNRFWVSEKIRKK